ncbi:MAG: carbohydrate kinase family protein [Candidatus Brockarchaeota archaeon]|nr:carbohydrate kinase family protein [Candidatus Brockarchaeota archaeon]
MALDVVAVGNLNVDLVFARTRSMPRWGEELLVPNFEMRAAGSAGYFAIAASRLGMKCGLVSCVGGDAYGEFMLEELKRGGIEARIKVERKALSGVCVSIVRNDGERAFVSYAGSLSKWGLADVRRNFRFISRARALYFGGYFFMQNLMAEKAEELMRSFSDAGVETVFDTGWDPEGWKPGTVREVRNVLRFVRVFLPNSKEAFRITGCSSPSKAAGKILGYGPQVVGIKLGHKGCMVANKDGKTKVPGFECEAFDATGAGDAFNAGFMLGYLSGWDLMKTAKFANATGALTVSSTRKGAERFPGRKEVEEFLAENDPDSWRDLSDAR